MDWKAPKSVRQIGDTKREDEDICRGLCNVFCQKDV